MSQHSSSSLSRARGEHALEACYEAFGFRFMVRSPSEAIAEAVDLVYEEMRTPSQDRARLVVDIKPKAEDPALLEVLFDGTPVFEAGRLGDLLHELDNQLSVHLEHSSPHLYFVHAAALADDKGGLLLVGESGAGKSTTTYALATLGLLYLSDELAPMEPSTGMISPYPRAICLKRDPPPPLRLPRRHLRTEWTLHIPATELGAPVALEPVPLTRVIFVRYSPKHTSVNLRTISRGHAAVRLYQSALNQLAHPGLGLDDTLRLIQRADCYELEAAGIAGTVRAVLCC